MTNILDWLTATAPDAEKITESFLDTLGERHMGVDYRAILLASVVLGIACVEELQVRPEVFYARLSIDGGPLFHDAAPQAPQLLLEGPQVFKAADLNPAHPKMEPEVAAVLKATRGDETGI